MISLAYRLLRSVLGPATGRLPTVLDCLDQEMEESPSINPANIDSLSTVSSSDNPFCTPLFGASSLGL